MLKKFSAVAVPFVGQLFTFAEIASRTGDNKILWSVRPSTLEGNHMIDVKIIAERAVAPIASALLVIVLFLNVLGVVGSFGYKFERASSMFSCSINIRVLFAILLMLRINALSISGVKIPQSRSLADLIALTPLTVHRALLLPVFIRPILTLPVVTGFTSGEKSVSVTWILSHEKVNFGRGQKLVALGAAFQDSGDIQHDNLLKLPPNFVVGPELGNSVVERVIRPLQAPHYYMADEL